MTIDLGYERYNNKYGNRNNYNKKYGNDRQGYNGRPNQNFQRGDPNGNYEMFYKNDPNFFVTVIKQEKGPHELSVKISKSERRYRQDHDPRKAPDLSINDIKTIVEEFGVKD